MNVPAVYLSLSELSSLLDKYDAISENKPYNLRVCIFTKFSREKF